MKDWLGAGDNGFNANTNEGARGSRRRTRAQGRPRHLGACVDDADDCVDLEDLLCLNPILERGVQAARGRFFDDDWLRRRERDLDYRRLRRGRGDEGKGVTPFKMWRRGVRRLTCLKNKEFWMEPK